MKTERVMNWMTTDVVTLRPKDTLPTARKLMEKHEIRRLPVVDVDGRPIGIITLGDVRAAEPSQATTLSVWEMKFLLDKVTVAKLMTPSPVTVTEMETIGTAARLMLENRISGLPVVDENGRLVGIITESDIFTMVVLHEWSVAEGRDEIRVTVTS